MPEAKWYVIHTYTGYENKVASNLEKVIKNRKIEDLIQEVKIPTETVVEVKDKKSVEKVKKIFPSYLLIKMILNDETWYVVRNIRGCTGFVGEDIKPLPLTDEEVSKLGIERRSVKIDYAVGDSVQIIDGSLKNFIGKVSEIDIENNAIKLIVSMFGRDTTVSLELNQVGRID